MYNPIAISLGFIDIRWYGLLIGTGAFMGLLLAIIEGRRFKLPADFFMDIVLIGLPTAVLCARVYYVLFNLKDYHSLGDMLSIWHGGIAIHGALIGALIGGGAVIVRNGYNFWRVADICAPSLIIGQIIGRWGNFMNQEAYGSAVSESFLRDQLHLPNWIVAQMNIGGVFHHPTFLYEMLWNIIGIIVLFIIRRTNWIRAGELLLIYFGWYSLGRFYVEGFRTDSLTVTLPNSVATFFNWLWSPLNGMFEAGALPDGNVRMAQLISMIILIVVITLIVVRRKTMNLPKYSDPVVSSKVEAKKSGMTV